MATALVKIYCDPKSDLYTGFDILEVGEHKQMLDRAFFLSKEVISSHKVSFVGKLPIEISEKMKQIQFLLDTNPTVETYAFFLRKNYGFMYFIKEIQF
jgi:hypothetical protein